MLSATAPITLSDINFITYLIEDASNYPPRITQFEFIQFLETIDEMFSDDCPFFFQDKDWIELVVQNSKKALHHIGNLRMKPEDFVDEENARLTFNFLKPNFETIDYFLLLVCPIHDSKELDSIAFRYKKIRNSQMFVSTFCYETYKRDFQVLDPTKTISLLAELPENWPGIIFWCRGGETLFLPIDNPDEYGLFLDQALEIFPSSMSDTDKLEKLKNELNMELRKKYRINMKIIQVSDLHFGGKFATKNEGHLMAYLHSYLEGKSCKKKFVITGDLFENPSGTALNLFNNFKGQLNRLSSSEVIVIPGNHDQRRLFGTLFKNYAQVMKLQMGDLISDEELGVVFYCFNSSETKNWGRGEITEAQTNALYKEAIGLHRRKKESRDFLSLALIHHHPYGYDPHEQIITRMKVSKNVLEEFFIKMDESDRFLKWCAHRNIPLILHGHNHYQRYITKVISYEDVGFHEERAVTAIGCGTSLGAEGKSLSCNVLQFDSAHYGWSITFLEDIFDGKGFVARKLVIKDQQRII